MNKILYIGLLILVASCQGNSNEKDGSLSFSLNEVGQAYSATSVNSAVFRQGSLVSNDSLQYISYYDGDGYMVLGKRKLDGGKWELSQTPFKGNIQDAHNIISLGLDGNGILHVAFDHHGSPLHYTKTVAPGTLELEELQPMTGVDEENVTYPEFHPLPSGDLIFVYRSGSSGNGNMVMKQFSAQDEKWSLLQKNLIDGENQRNAYWQMFIDRTGVIHLSWVWRESWLVETNHDLSYAMSEDGGKTWKRSDGSPYLLPITQATAEMAWEIPQNSELINQTAMTADIEGHPYIATYWRDGNSKVPQYRLVYHDGKEWKMKQVGDRKTPFSLSGGGTKMIPISRPRVVSDGKKAFYIFRDEERGSVVSVAFTPEIENNEWEIFDVTDFPVDAWEPSLDNDLWNRENKLNIFVQRTHQGDGEQISENSEKVTTVYVAEGKP